MQDEEPYEAKYEAKNGRRDVIRQPATAAYDAAYREAAARQAAMHPITASLGFDLIFDDGAPVETNRHYWQMVLTRESIERLMLERDRRDYWSGSNMFVYYSPKQARAVAVEEGVLPAESVSAESEPTSNRPAYRGPDVFWVGGVEGHERQGWVAWEEEERYPDVIFELLSKSTSRTDRTTKKDLYAEVFETSEYFLWGPLTFELEGYRLLDGRYRRLRPDEQGRLWSRELEIYVGPWDGSYHGFEGTWLRFFEPSGRRIPTEAELLADARARVEEEARRAEDEARRAEVESRRAEDEARRAEVESRRAEEAEAEVARLRALLEATRQPDTTA